MTESYEQAVVVDSLKEISSRIEKAVVGEDQLEILAALGMVAVNLLASLPEPLRPAIFNSWLSQIREDANIGSSDAA
jgi:hypothetical protein